LVRVALGAESGLAERSDESGAMDGTVCVHFGRESNGNAVRHHLVSVAQTQFKAFKRQENGLQARYGQSLVHARSQELGPTTG